MSDIPERVYLGYDGSIFGWGWSSERERDSDVEYTRADIAAEEREKLVAEVERLRKIIRRAPCSQNSIPCGWPCWKQKALALTTPDATGGDGWRSIESAPADETFVLLAWWDGLSESWRYSVRPYSNLDIARQGQGYTDGWATHWRPLPPPPAREGGKERWVAISTY